MKILYFDTETTGLTENSSIIQIAGMIQIDKKIVERFNIFSKPFEGADVSQEALDVHGLTLEQINSFQDSKDATKQIIDILNKYVNKFDKKDKYIVAGYNVEFDINKLSTFLKKNGENYLFSYIDNKKLDPMHWILPLQILGKIPYLENNRLGTWCDYFEIEIIAHDGMSDIEATRKLIIKLIELMK